MTTKVTTVKEKYCDRCGSQMFDYSYGTINGWSESSCSYQGDWGGCTHRETLDLCSHCIASFRDWLKHFQKEEVPE